MRPGIESIRTFGIEESLCIINKQDTHVSFNIHEYNIPCRIIEPVVTRAGSLEILSGFNMPEHIPRHPTSIKIY